MASAVCQGLQSCLEPRFIDPLVLSHKLATPLLQKPNFEEINPLKNNIGERENEKKSAGWSFLKALETPSSNANNHAKNDQQVYVHPMAKRSAAALSTKSLAMCTESLGSETGSESGDELPPLSSGIEVITESMDEFPKLCVIESSKCRVLDRIKIVNNRSRRGEFPPPLTSISGSDGTVKVRPHREGGRLVMKAVSFSSCGANFQAQRTNGRLQLSLLKDCCVNLETEWVKMKKEAGVVETEHEHDATAEEEEEEEEFSDDDDEEEVVVEDDGAEVAEEEEGGGGWGWDMDGKRRKVEGGTGIGIGGELKRPTRCKEGGNGRKGIPRWNSYWVAIS